MQVVEMEVQKAIVFDYKTVKVKRETETMLTDAYATLGWQVTSTTMADASLSCVNVSFKRDRKIAHKSELDLLQKKIDAHIASIEKLISQKKRAGLPEAITMGTIGTLVFGGGMSMTMLLEGMGLFIGGIAVGVTGIAIGLLGWLISNKVKNKKHKRIEPLLEAEFDKFSAVCEQASCLTQQQTSDI